MSPKLELFYLKLTANRKTGSFKDVFKKYAKNFKKEEILSVYSKFEVNDSISVFIRKEIYGRIDPLHRIKFDVVFYFFDSKIKNEVVKRVPRNRRRELRNNILREASVINSTYASNGSEKLTKSCGNLTCVKMKHSINIRLHYFVFDETTAVIFCLMNKSSSDYTEDEITSIRNQMKSLPDEIVKENLINVKGNEWINESVDFDSDFVSALVENSEGQVK